jgi:hypothetical protein
MEKWGYREVYAAFAIAATVGSLVFDAAQTRAMAGAYHTVITLLYSITLPFLELDRSDVVTIELVMVQLMMAIFHMFDNMEAWHYVYFPTMAAVFVLVVTFRPADTSKEDASLFGNLHMLKFIGFM